MGDQTNELQLRAVGAKVVLNKKGIKHNGRVQTGGKCSQLDRTVQKKKAENLPRKNGRTVKNTSTPVSQRIE